MHSKIRPSLLIALGVLSLLGIPAICNEVSEKKLQLWKELNQFSEEVSIAMKSGQIRTLATGENMGLIEAASSEPPSKIKTLINEVNALRKEYFRLLTKEQIDVLVRYDLEKQMVTGERVVMRLATCESAFKKLLPELLPAFMRANGFDEIRARLNHSTFTVFGKKLGGGTEQAIVANSYSNEECYDRLYAGRCDAIITSREAFPSSNARFVTAKLADFTLPSYVTMIGVSAAIIVRTTAGDRSLNELRYALSQVDQCHVLTDDWGAAEWADLVSDVIGMERDAIKNVGHSSVDSLAKALRTSERSASLGFLRLGTSAGDLKTLSVRGRNTWEAFEPSTVNIRTENYPLIQTLQMNVTEGRSQIVKALQVFLRSEATPIIKKAGWIPLTSVDPADKDAWKNEAELRHTRYSKLVSEGGIPSYAEIIQGADRMATPFVLRFESGATDINLYSNMNPQALPNIRNLVSHLARTGWNEREVVLIGHTDPKKPRGYTNKELGNRRVANMKQELEAMGVPVAQMRPTPSTPPDDETREIYGNSMGSLLPAANADDQNRRVEIWVKDRSKSRAFFRELFRKSK